MAVKGFNTDLVLNGSKFHVQSEDWGEDNPLLVTKVFCNGAVVESLKTPYDVKLYRRNYLNFGDAIQNDLKKQHFRILENLHLKNAEL